MEMELPPYTLEKGMKDLDKVVLRDSHGCSAEIYLYGGHVTSWKNADGDELLYLSSKATFKPPTPIRGGILLCFPQVFSIFGPLKSHGFARNTTWEIDDNPHPLPNSCPETFVDLILRPTEHELMIWPHSFEYRLRVALGPDGELTLTSRIMNTNNNGKPFTFTFAYHPYFSVSDICEVRIEGLETLNYLDNLKNRECFTEQYDAITFESEINRIYLDTPRKIAIMDHGKRRTFVIRKNGLPDAVVWNPWDKKTKMISDMSNEDYEHMVCVDAAAIERPVTLKPGEEWKGTLQLTLVPSTNFDPEDSE